MKGHDIKERLAQSGKKQSALAAHMGRSVHSIYRLVNSNRELKPSEAALVEAFMNDNAAPPEPAMLRVRVYGYAAAGGHDRVAMGSDDILEHVEIPAGLMRGEIIGIRIVGDSMEPRLFSGETVFVVLNVPPSRGGDCVVELKDGSALVKEYRGRRDGHIFLHQYNPPEEVRLRDDQIRSIHSVWMNMRR